MGTLHPIDLTGVASCGGETGGLGGMSDNERIIAKLVDLLMEMQASGAKVPNSPHLTDGEQRLIDAIMDKYLVETYAKAEGDPDT